MTDCPRLRAQIEAFCPYNEQETADRLQMLQDIDTFPVLLTRDNATAHFTASCWIVNPDRTKVLMAYHNLYQSWAWLGGHADGEEDLLAAALREANEESGIRAVPVSRDIFSLEILHVAPHVKRGKFVCGTCKGWTLAQVADRRAASLRWYVKGYQGENNILRAAAAIIWDSLQEKQAG